MTNNSATTPPNSAPLLEFGGFTIPAGCRRIFITAELEPSNGDPRIQPTGFPDVGPVLYPDPAGKNGNICLIDGEAKVSQFLEEVCLNDKYKGEWRTELAGLPYIKLTKNGKADGEFVTATTIDGHRFASEYVMNAQFAEVTDEMKEVLKEQTAASKKTNKGAGKSALAKKSANEADPPAEFVLWVRHLLGMKSKDRCPAANVPKVFTVAMEHDPMALLHGFQISVKDKLTFVGLRSARALTGSVIGLRCERLAVPGVRFDPIGTAAASQAIFQKQRITAERIEARFCLDVGLLASMRLGENEQSKAARLELLLKIALCKIAWFLGEMQDGKRLRTECDLRLVKGGAKFWLNRIDGEGTDLDFNKIIEAASKGLGIEKTASLGFSKSNSPLVLKHALTKAKKEGATDEEGVDENAESGGDEDSGQE
jgi:CRISPR-associated protein Csb1